MGRREILLLEASEQAARLAAEAERADGARRVEARLLVMARRDRRADAACSS